MSSNETSAAALEPARAKNRPRLRTLQPTGEERHASWLELFFDLVFVLAVAQIAHVLTEHTDGPGFLKYVAIFVPLWWAWVGFTFYADRFETEEATYRVLMFGGMLAVAGLSLTFDDVSTPLGDRAFIICYVIVRLVLVALYLRAAYYVPLARSYCLQFIVGLSVSALILLASLAFDPPVRYAIWAGALLIELLIPYFNIRATRIIPIDRSHIPERFGLFTIIVLGEAVIATGTGASEVAWNAVTIVTASLGFAMAACIWWINFDFVEDDAIRSNSIGRRAVYMYGHFFIVSSIVALGIGVEHAIKEATAEHLHLSTLALINGSTAVFLATITVVRLVTGICNLVYVRVVAITASLILLFAGQFVPPVVVVAASFVVLLANILIEGRFSFDGDEDALQEAAHLTPCEHADQILTAEPRSNDGCEECRKNNYKWVHLRLCMTCGHVGCCDSSVHKHATKHFREHDHPIIASLEPAENWAWCYVDQRFVPVPKVNDDQ